MAIMYIPRQRSPWEQMLPQILGQLAVMKVQQNFQAKQAEMQREHELTKEAMEKRYEAALKTHEAERKFGEKVAEVGGRRYIMTPAGLVYDKEPGKAVTSKTAPKGTQQIISPEGRRYLMPPPVPVTVGGQTIGYQRGTKFIKAPTAKKTGVPSPTQALKRISTIRKEMATFDKTSLITQALATQFPELAPYIGQKIPKELKDNVFRAWNQELDYLEQLVPGESSLSTLSDEDLINKLVPIE